MKEETDVSAIGEDNEDEDNYVREKGEHGEIKNYSIAKEAKEGIVRNHTKNVNVEGDNKARKEGVQVSNIGTRNNQKRRPTTTR